MIQRFVMLVLSFVIGVSLVARCDAKIYENTCNNMKYCLPKTVTPMHYSLKLIPHIIPNNFTFYGEVKIALQVRTATSNIAFHQKNLTIDYDSTYLTTQQGFFFRVPIAHNYDEDTEIVTLTFEHAVQPNNYTLFLKFKGVLNTRKTGFYRAFYVNDEKETVWLAGTYLEQISARQSFPCMDEPALKATFDIAIKHYPNYTVLSNMPVQKRSETDKSDGKVWTTFQRTPPMSTYLVAYVISDYVNISNSDGTVNIWCRKDVVSSAKFAHNIIQRALVEAAEYFNSSLPVPKMDNVAINGGASYIGEENWGVIIYKESEILYNEALQSEFVKEEIVLLIVHEILHQWLGNSVTIDWWSHLWLKEGLTSYLHFSISDKLFEEWNIMDMFVPKILHLALEFDAERTMSLSAKVWSPSEIPSKVNYINYDKGPSVFRMLAHCMSQDLFRRGVLLYLQKYKFDVASPDDLWLVMQGVLDESRDPSDNFEIKKFMDTWFDQVGFPLVKVTIDRGNGTVTLTQAAFGDDVVDNQINTFDTPNNGKWWIPISFATKSDPNFARTIPSHWLTPEMNSLTLTNIDPNDWIIINIQQTSFYRVNYDDASWKLIADYLNSEDFTKIHVLNRAQLLNDAFHMMLSKRLNPVRFMELTEYLKQEKHLIPWLTFNDLLDATVGAQVLNTKGFKPYIWSLLGNMIENLGFDDRPDDDYLTRKTRDAMKHRSCYYNHPQCIEHAHRKLLAFLADPKNNRTPTSLLPRLVKYGLQNANETTWRKVVETCKDKPAAVKTSIGCVNDLSVIKMFLKLSYVEESSLPLNEYKDAIQSILFCHPEYISVVVDFMTEHWQKMITRIDNPASFIKYYQSYVMRDLSDGIWGPETVKKLIDFLRSTGVSYSQPPEEPQKLNERMQSILSVIEQWLKNHTSATNGNTKRS